MAVSWQKLARDMKRWERLQERAAARVRAILSRAPYGWSYAIASETSVRTWELLSSGWWVRSAQSRDEPALGRQMSQAEQSSLLRAERAMYAAGMALRNHPTPNVFEAAELERVLEQAKRELAGEHCPGCWLNLIHEQTRRELAGEAPIEAHCPACGLDLIRNPPAHPDGGL